ncbi:hypothetical protein BHE74_00016327 [Ensete ventricosum]|nr:hypothetical protein BHE74_00016327 [Ensete ventricosum]
MSSTGGTAAEGGRGKPKASKSITRSQKAGLQFPVGRISRYRTASTSTEWAPAAPSTFPPSSTGGEAARDNKKNRIVPRHIWLAIRNDEKLS